MSALRVQSHPGGVRFAVHVQPRASRTELCGLHGDALKIRLQAPPVDGAANEALVSFIAGELGIPRQHVRVVTGATARQKLLEVAGVDETRILALAAEVKPGSPK